MTYRKTLAAFIVLAVTAACQDQPIPFDVDPATTSTLSHYSGGSAFVSPFNHGYPIDSAGTYRWNIHAYDVVDGYWCSFSWYRTYSGGARNLVHTSMDFASAGQCSNVADYTLTLPCGVNIPSFTLDVVVSQNDVSPPTTIFSYLHNVPIQSPFSCSQDPPGSFAVEINGPTQLSQPGTFMWQANASGGSGSFTYQWEIRYPEIGGGWGNLGTSKTQYVMVAEADGDIELRVSVLSGAESATDVAYVTNTMSCSPEIFC